MTPLIKIKDVFFKYSTDGASVLDGVSLDVQKGEFLALIGANGSGKSTLAKHMNAILLPTDGVVEVDGMDTADEQYLYDIRKRVGMVFQNPDNQIVATIVEQDVAFALENLGYPPEKIRERVDEALEVVGMLKHRNDSPHKLSGGQKQRVAIAGVLAMRPECIILDEPTAMLDPRGRERVIRTVKQLNEQQGITVVLITHYMEEAALASRVVAMSAGKIVRDGTPQEVFSDAAGIRALGLDVPATTELCVELHKKGIAIASDIVSPDECVQRLCELLEGVR